MMDENSFDPTPKLKSSPVPMLFIPVSNNEDKCGYCRSEYSVTLTFKQKYCKNCLFWYIKYISDSNDNTYLDIHITNDTQMCIRHKSNRYPIYCTQNIQEWCEYCSEISYFKQIVTNHSSDSIRTDKIVMENLQYCKLRKNLVPDYSSHSRMINLMYCKLCGILNLSMYKNKFSLCSNCYRISSGWIESTLTKKPIPILYLPWWDTLEQCISCKSNLILISDCQKWCSNCFIIHAECRYCLTTNITIGITDRSQCRKCKRILSINIDITNISTGGSDDVDEFLASTRSDVNDYNDIANYMNNIDKDSSPLEIYQSVESKLNYHYLKQVIKWIPYSQIKNLEKIAEGGFGIIYKAVLATSSDVINVNRSEAVAVKKFLIPQNISKCFLNELKSLHQFYNTPYHIIKSYGITKDPKTGEYMLITKYADGGNLHDHLQKNFTNVTWKRKLDILWSVSMGLRTIHGNNFIHRDLHSGNILLEKSNILIGDLGLSNIVSNEIYVVIPYIAPEIFKGVAFSKASDIYSMGMILWELTTGYRPFADVEHDTDLIYEIIDGKQPEITIDTPECFANLMKRCLDSDPLKRPSIIEISETVHNWCYKEVYAEQFIEAEKNRSELIQLKKLGPKFTDEKSHSGVTHYTVKPLNSYVSEVSSANLFSIKENKNKLKTSTEESSNDDKKYISKECDFDINVDTQRKRKIKESNIETQNDGKHIKADANQDSKF